MLRVTRTARFALVCLLAVALVAAALAVSGCRKDTVPDVTNMKPADAVRTLQEAGYLLGNTTEAKTDKVPHQQEDVSFSIVSPRTSVT